MQVAPVAVAQLPLAYLARVVSSYSMEFVSVPAQVATLHRLELALLLQSETLFTFPSALPLQSLQSSFFTPKAIIPRHKQPLLYAESWPSLPGFHGLPWPFLQQLLIYCYKLVRFQLFWA